MYNGIGLTTPRGSGTNGHVQRNWAFVRPGKKENSNYRSEEDIKKLDATLNRPPNKDILDHDRKRKIEVKCLEFEEILEKQGLSTDEIKAKVDSYRQKLMGQGKTDLPKDEFGRIARKKSQRNKNNEASASSLSTATTTQVVKHKTISKAKQYFQHDNRLGQKETKIKQTLFSSSSTFNKYTESQILYNEVANKFKPLNASTNNNKSQKYKKAFLKYQNQRKQKTANKQLKNFLALKAMLDNNSSSNPKIIPPPALALAQPQCCLCLCQEKQNNCYNNKSNNLESRTAVICNINNKITPCSSTNPTPFTTGIPNQIIENNLPKILEILQNQTPTFLLETLINNSKLIEYKNKEQKRVRDTHQIAEAQQEKNAKLREAFNISEYFVEGSSFDSDRKAKEDLAKSLALQKELDTQREQAAAASANERESSKRYALVRTPSMERNVSLGDVGGNGDNDDHTNKKKKKKIMRESSASPARKKDKKKKSKKRKKESKSKKSKKLRKRKSSDSESNAENGKDSANEDTDSDSEVDVKKSRKKSKKDKKKREKKNKKKERSSSSDKSRSTSPINKLAETKKSETITGKKSSGNPFRSRSKEKSNKSKESQRRHYESSQESRNRRSRSRNNKDLIKCRSRSSGDKDLCNRHTRIENDSRNVGRRDDKRDSYQKHKSSSSDNRSRECNERDYNNRDIDRDRENRRSRSRQRSRRVDTAERLRDLKRKYSEEHLQRKRDSPSVDKRKKYSCSPSQSRSRHSRDNKSYAITTQIISTPSRTRSRTPRHKSSDRQQFQRVNTSRSRSIKENMRNKSLTPTARITELTETNESKKTDTNNINNQEKDVLNSVSSSQKDAKHTGRKSRSRNTSSSSSDSASSTDSVSSRSRTPSPKKELLEKASVAKNIDTIKPSSRKTKSPSLKRTPSPANKRSKSRNLLIEKNTEDKLRPVSISRESREKSNEKREEYIQLTSKTPPPSRVEKKALSPRSSRDSSELSYSPARRNPERYRDILENTKNQKTEKRKPVDKDEGRKDPTKSSKQSEERERDRKEKGGKCDKNSAKPVVRLQSQSEDESDATERNAEKMLDEFQESKRERELKDLKMLEQLKTGIAAKAKEKIKTIEKMAACTSTSSSSNTGAEPLVAALADSSLVDAIVSKVSTATVAAAESAARRGRSRSRRSRSRNRREDKPSNGGSSNNGGGGGEREGNRRRSTSHSRSSRSSSSSRSRSRSHSRRSSRSHSSHSSSSSRSSSRSSSSSSFGSSRSGTRSPSIPRRRGSPSFLDRRRITSRYSASRDRRH